MWSVEARQKGVCLPSQPPDLVLLGFIVIVSTPFTGGTNALASNKVSAPAIGCGLIGLYIPPTL
jgi:hypothetical protein